MFELFDKFKSESRIAEAIMIAANLFNRHPSSHEVFKTYFDYLCSLGEKAFSLNDRQNMTERAGTALAFYSENAELDNKTVEYIVQAEKRLMANFDSIFQERQRILDKENEEIKVENNKKLKSLAAVTDKISKASSQEDFDKILVELSTLDAGLDRDVLTEAQVETYVSLTKESTDFISSKMRELEHKKNREYNKQAVESYANAFKSFMDNESMYANQTQLFDLASKSLFAYDASRLFNETLIYYNHIYSYIFNKLDDDGKLALTRFSIECERKLR